MATPNQKRGKLQGLDLRADGAVPVFQFIRALNKSYEGTVTAGNTPVIIDFRGDQGWNSLQGWITCDGTIVTGGSTEGNIIVSFSRDGITYGDKWSMRVGENTNLMGFDIAKIKIEHTGIDSEYRVFLV